MNATGIGQKSVACPACAQFIAVPYTFRALPGSQVEVCIDPTALEFHIEWHLATDEAVKG
jgi:hypothetical protein